MHCHSGVVYLLVCGLLTHCPQSGDTAVPKVPLTAVKSPSDYRKKIEETQNDYASATPIFL